MQERESRFLSLSAGWARVGLALLWLAWLPTAHALRPSSPLPPIVQPHDTFLTSPLQTRVGGCEPIPSGRLFSEGFLRLEMAKGCDDFAYEIVPGRRVWPNRDPIGIDGGINLYAYVGNKPTSLFDPWGLEWRMVNPLDSLPKNLPADEFAALAQRYGGPRLVNVDDAGTITDTIDLVELFDNQSLLLLAQPLRFSGLDVLPKLTQGTGSSASNDEIHGAKTDPSASSALLTGAPNLVGTPVGDDMADLNGLLLSSLTPLVIPTKSPTPSLVDDILNWIGPNSKLETPVGGSDLILRSADATRQIRFDLRNPHGLQPHINVETFRPRNLFPGDRNMIPIDNFHVFPKP